MLQTDRGKVELQRVVKLESVFYNFLPWCRSFQIQSGHMQRYIHCIHQELTGSMAGYQKILPLEKLRQGQSAIYAIYIQNAKCKMKKK